MDVLHSDGQPLLLSTEVRPYPSSRFHIHRVLKNVTYNLRIDAPTEESYFRRSGFFNPERQQIFADLKNSSSDVTAPHRIQNMDGKQLGRFVTRSRVLSRIVAFMAFITLGRRYNRISRSNSKIFTMPSQYKTERIQVVPAQI